MTYLSNIYKRNAMAQSFNLIETFILNRNQSQVITKYRSINFDSCLLQKRLKGHETESYSYRAAIIEYTPQIFAFFPQFPADSLDFSWNLCFSCQKCTAACGFPSFPASSCEFSRFPFPGFPAGYLDSPQMRKPAGICGKYSTICA